MTLEQYLDYLVEWLRETAKNANAKGMVVGLSGGIDSSVVAHLIKRAFPNDSFGIIMPCKSIDKDKQDALKVVESSGIDYAEVNLTETHNQLMQALGTVNNRMTDANTRARLRMTTLYAVASERNYLVVGTDNAAEWFTGYFTKFGDGGVDIVPLVHLTKGEVREAARILGVHEDIINKAPSAGLWEGQTDENEMGTTYNTIDAYLKGQDVPEKDKEIIERMHKNTEHKRNLAGAPKPRD